MPSWLAFAASTVGDLLQLGDLVRPGVQDGVDQQQAEQPAAEQPDHEEDERRPG
jgi:hypothetical protein